VNPEIVLRKIYDEFSARNSRNSLRVFARESGINLSTLSRIFSGYAKLSYPSSVRLLRNIRPSPELVRLLAASYFEEYFDFGQSGESPEVIRSPDSEREPDEFQTISLAEHPLEWLDFAILDLFTIKSAEQTVTGIANRLGVSQERIMSAIDRLEATGLLKLRGESTYVKSTRQFIVKADGPSFENGRKIHLGLFQRASEIFHQVAPQEVGRRHVTSYTCAIDPKRLPEARKRIEDFQRELVTYLGEGDVREVYGWSSFFVPLTRSLN
jgi:uncharacterized protein (TIGR02147 family)